MMSKDAKTVVLQDCVCLMKKRNDDIVNNKLVKLRNQNLMWFIIVKLQLTLK